jgi:S1-C subfamily serine protease
MTEFVTGIRQNLLLSGRKHIPAKAFMMSRRLSTVAALALASLILPPHSLAGIAPIAPACADLAAVDTARRATVTIRIPGADGEEEAVGAGFVHRGSGKIVTNAHVVGDLDLIRIGLADGRIITARVTARDTVADIALIEADIEGLPGLDFSETPVQVGETVHAVGTPFGLGQTVTRGIVSALDRTIDATTPFGMIQHDAALNPGSSGGPVIDAGGKVIGVNVAMPDGFRRDVGIAYAIPAAIAERAVTRLAAGIATAERRIGVTLRALTPRLAEAIGVEANSGALVESVQPHSPAEKAGIVASDIILRVGTHPVNELRDVAIGIDRSDVAAPIAIEILRGTEKITLQLAPAPVVMADNRPKPKQPLRGGRPPVPASELGIVLGSGDAAEILGIGKGTVAAAAGLAAGDVILAVGRAPVSGAAEAKRLIGPVVARPFAILLADAGGGTRYVVVDPHAGGLDGDGLSGNMRNPRSASY